MRDEREREGGREAAGEKEGGRDQFETEGQEINREMDAKDSLCQNKCMYFINVLLIFNYWYVKVHINCISVYKKDLIMFANFKALI